MNFLTSTPLILFSVLPWETEGMVGLSGQLGLNHDTPLNLGIIQCQSWRSCLHALSFRAKPSPTLPTSLLCWWLYMVVAEGCYRVTQSVPCTYKSEGATLGYFLAVCCSLLLIMNKAGH